MKKNSLKPGRRRRFKIFTAVFTVIIIGSIPVLIFVNTGGRKDLYVLNYDRSSSFRNIAVIIPGMNQSEKSPGYDAVCGFYENAGITPVMVNVDWMEFIFDNNQQTELLDSLINNTFPDSNIYLFGFSAGAAETFRLSQKMNSRQTILCSMSPVFKEDRAFIGFPFKQILNIMNDLPESFSSPDKGKGMYFLYGEHDSKVLSVELVKNRNIYFDNAKTIIVKNAGHNISSAPYLAEVEKIIKEIKHEP